MPNNTVRFSDFFAFLVAACFVVAVFVAPYIMAWHYLDSHFSRMAEHDSRPLAEGSGLALPGAPNAPSRPGIPGTPHRGKSGATSDSSGLEDCSPLASPVDSRMRSVAAASEVGSLHGLKCGDLAAARSSGDEGPWKATESGLTPRRDGDTEDSSRFGLFALTHRGDPRWEMGRGGASLEGLQTLANAAAGLCGIDPALFWSLVLRESSGRHWDAEGRARGLRGVGSRPR